MRHRATIGLALAATAALPGYVSGIEARYDLGFYSHYVWRGITLTDDPVLQPSIELAHRSGFSLTVWGNVDLGDANDNAGDFNELDLTLEYAWRLERLELAVGLTEYTFPNTPFSGTREAFARLTRIGAISPCLTAYYDLDEYKDVYANLALELGTRLNRRWRFSVAASAGYAGEGFAIGASPGLHDGNLKLELAYGGDRVSVGVVAAYTESLDEDVLLEQPVQLWGGLNVELDF
jgi:uncharacterized protein (TIGR02001 family)